MERDDPVVGGLRVVTTAHPERLVAVADLGERLSALRLADACALAAMRSAAPSATTSLPRAPAVSDRILSGSRSRRRPGQAQIVVMCSMP
jgi:hypothetical protein